jgi:DNA-binding NarL/FixJ family response regulator
MEKTRGEKAVALVPERRGAALATPGSPGRTGRAQEAGEAVSPPVKVLLVSIRTGLFDRLAAGLRADHRCHLRQSDPESLLRNNDLNDVDAVIIDHVLYSNGYFNELRKNVRRAIILGLLQRSELLNAAECLVHAHGFLFADTHPDHALDVIACAMVGYCALPAEMGQINPFHSERLRHARAMTSREKSILRQLGQGRANREIARAIGVSEAQVKATVRTILQRLSLTNRTEAAVFYVWNCNAIEV